MERIEACVKRIREKTIEMMCDESDFIKIELTALVEQEKREVIESLETYIIETFCLDKSKKNCIDCRITDCICYMIKTKLAELGRNKQ